MVMLRAIIAVLFGLQDLQVTDVYICYTFSTDMGRFLGETLVGESLSSRAEVQRAGLLQRLEPHIRQLGADITSSPNTPPPYLDMNGPKSNIHRMHKI